MNVNNITITAGLKSKVPNMANMCIGNIMWTNEETGASCVCKAKQNALCFKVFIRFGQKKGSWLGCCAEGCWDGWGQPWQPLQDFPNITWVLLIHSSNEDTGQKSRVFSCPAASLFCLKANSFIASQGYLSKHKTMGKCYQYWHCLWQTPGWLGEVSLSGMSTGKRLSNTSVGNS